MRKSNWIIFGIIVVASIFFLWLWFYLGLNAVDWPLDLIVTIIWWLIIIVLCYVIHRSEKRRQKALRTIFLAPTMVYNRERGAVKIEPGTPAVPVMQKVLSGMKYGFDYYDIPSNQTVRFKYIVQTDKFKDDGDTWEGEVINVARAKDPMKFSDMEELTRLVSEL